MKRLFKNKKGMSLIEVMIALAVLGLLTVPVMAAFMNTQRYAKKIDKQTEISSVTRTVKQIVMDGLLDIHEMKYKDGITYINEYPNDSANDTFRDFISFMRTNHPDDLKESRELEIRQSNSADKNEKYMYKLAYKHSDFYDGVNFPNVYNVLIKIIERDSNSVVNQIKIAVKIDNF